jgi:hypothetical protein
MIARLNCFSAVAPNKCCHRLRNSNAGANSTKRSTFSPCNCVHLLHIHYATTIQSSATRCTCPGYLVAMYAPIELPNNRHLVSVDDGGDIEVSRLVIACNAPVYVNLANDGLFKLA